MKFCSLYSGSSGNCLYIEDEDTKIIIDAGLSGKKIESALKSIDISPLDIDALLVSHDHIDHTKGLGVLSRRYNIPIYANGGTWQAVRSSLGKLVEENIQVFNTHKIVNIGNLNIKPFPVVHDACEPVGFNIYNHNKKVSIITDTGMITEEILLHIKNSDLVLIESNHDIELLKVGRYPYYLKKRILSNYGHLSNEDAAKTILQLVKQGLRKVVLAHLSEENNFPELAYETTTSLLRENGIIIDKDVYVEVASRFKPSNVYNL
ncbi:MAG: MBL fold metallo-hydrolase [Eubacteriales bacterium]